jgi:putative ABC transport system permease protein
VTTLAQPSPQRASRTSGIAARRAIARWAWRMICREWRQQILVVTLLSVAVAVAIASVTIAYNASPADSAEFGSANHLLRFNGSNPQALEAALASANKWFKTTDTIGHRSLPVPGSFQTIDFRAQDPNGAYGSGLLAIRQGRYPVGAGQVAVTDGVAELLGLRIGPYGRRHRREPAQAKRRVRARLRLIRGNTRLRHGLDQRQRRLYQRLPAIPRRHRRERSIRPGRIRHSPK